MHKLRFKDILLAALVAVPSTVFMTILLYLRQPKWILEAYYQDPAKDFIRDLFSEFMPHGVVLLIYAGVLGVYLLLGKVIQKRSVASILIAVIISFNINTALSMELGGMTEIFLPVGVFWNAVMLIGSVLFVSQIIDLMYWGLQSMSSREGSLRIETADSRSRAIALSFICLWVCWQPGLIFCYPGGANRDTIQQVESWLGGCNIEASNPLLATAFYGISYSLGKAFRGDNAGWFFAVQMQAVVCSAAITYCADYIRQITGSKRGQAATVLYFALLPTWQNAVVQLLKDVLHTGCFLLFYVWFLKALEEDGTGKGTFLKLFTGAFIISYTRRAAFYIALIAIIVVVIVQRKHFFIKAVICLLCTLISYYAPSILLYPMLNIEPEREEESYSMQLQQLAYYCRTHQEELTQEEINIINATVDYDAVLHDFTPMGSDPVKKTYHGSDEDHIAFWKLYNQMLKKHPLTMLRAVYMCTFEHLNPWYRYIFEYGISQGPDVQIFHTDPHIDDMGAYWESWREIPLVRMTLVTGLYTWLIMALMGYSAHTRSKKVLCGLIPAFVLFVGLFMSHVNGMLRYGYPLIAVSPLLVAWTVHAGRTSQIYKKEVEPLYSLRTAKDVFKTHLFSKDGILKNIEAVKRRLDNGVFPLIQSWFFHRLNAGNLGAAKRVIMLYRVISSIEITFQRESKSDEHLSRIRLMNKQLYQARCALDLASQIVFFLNIWSDLQDVPKRQLLIGIQSGTVLLEKAKQYEQELLGFQMPGLDLLMQKITELKEAYH